MYNPNNDGQNATPAENLISLEDVDFSSKSKMINSPRSLEACNRVGIQPSELYQISQEDFKKKYPDLIGMSDKLIQYRYEAEEKFRKETVNQVIEERKKIIEEKEKGEAKTSKEANEAEYTQQSVYPL